jgi:predicted NodU family carbamoyl transferase
MRILGLSCYYHDSAAALLVDGMLIAAAEEERFTRKKHDYEFPINAIEFCLKQGGIRSEDLDYVVFYEKPFQKFERILRTAIGTFPKSWLVFREAMQTWLKDKLWVRETIRKKLGVPEGKILFIDHHLSHAASAFFASPFEKAAILTIDHHRHRPGKRLEDQARPRDKVSALARAALQRVHGIPRVRGQRGRIQGHGHGPLREAKIYRQGSQAHRHNA